MTRRQVLVGAAAAAALAAIPAGLLQAGGTPPGASLVRSTFIPLVGSQFRVVGRATQITLTAVADLAPILRPADEQRFALHFVGPAGAVPGGIIPLAHQRAGTIPLAVNPVGRTSGDLVLLEAVINNHF